MNMSSTLAQKKHQNLTSKVYRRLLMSLSSLWIPPSRRHVRHLKLQNYQMLVLENEAVGRQLRLFGNFEKHETEYFSKHVRTGDICVDVGGNIGFFSMLFASLAPRGEVHVFEPLPLNSSLIRANVELNRFTNVRIVESAVGDHVGEVEFALAADSAFSSMKDTQRCRLERVLRTPITTLDLYTKTQGIQKIDILKMDVEGSEGLVIEGAKQLLENPDSRPRLLLIELFDPNLRMFGTNSKEIITALARYGYAPYFIPASGQEPCRYDPDKHKAYYNVLFMPDMNIGES